MPTSNTASKAIKPIALTPGEPAGIGPDLILQLAQSYALDDIIVVASPDLLRIRADELGIPITLLLPEDSEFNQTVSHGTLKIQPVPLKESCFSGQLDTANAEYVLNTLDIAIDGCHTDKFSAMVTGPVQKSIINDAGITFSGHTEYLAEKLNAERPVMLLANTRARVALVTTHIPVARISAQITKERVEKTIRIAHTDLTNKFAITKPRILVLGLNPHAGESGHLGKDELEIIQPVIEKLRREGLSLTGPIPADTAFTEKYLNQTDIIISMYHDQGLPPLKALGFGETVNITLGLPIIRTSVDHGTAIELAGTGKAECNSLYAAIEAARFMIENQKTSTVT